MLKAKILLTVIMACLLLSCKSVKVDSADSYEIINSLTESDSNRKTKIYYKTIFAKYDGTQIKELLKNYNLKFNLCSKSVYREKAKITENEINHLKEKFQYNTSKNLVFSKLENQSRFTKRKSESTVYISEPKKFRNGEYAIYYSEGRYGGQFNLLHKDKSEWQIVCSSTVWIE
jgi:hypothetical protein